MILATLEGAPSPGNPGQTSGVFIPDRVSRHDLENGAFWLAGCCLIAGENQTVEELPMELPFRISEVETEDGVYSGAYYPEQVTLGDNNDFALHGGFFVSDDGTLSGFSLGKMFKFKIPSLKFPKLNFGSIGKQFGSIGKQFGKVTKSIGKSAQKFISRGSDVIKKAGKTFEKAISKTGKAFEKGISNVGKSIENVASSVLQPAMDMLSSGATPGSDGMEQLDESIAAEQYPQEEPQDPAAWILDETSGTYYNGYEQWLDPASGQVYDPQTGEWSEQNAA